MAVKLVRIQKYERFIQLMKEHFGGGANGIDKDLGVVWFKVDGKKVYLDIWFKNFYKNEVFDGSRFMMYEVHYIRVVKIGEREIGYSWILQGVNVPANGYIHEKSGLYAFLEDLKNMVSTIG